MAIYLLGTLCGKPLMRIGQEFGVIHYRSVSSAAERIKKKRRDDNRLKKVIESIKKGQT